MSSVFVATPYRTAYLFRLVYFPDSKIYDLIPEYSFPESLKDEVTVEGLWPRRVTWYAGAVVQASRMDLLPPRKKEGGEKGVLAGGWGVKVIIVACNGEASWWTVQRRDDEAIGIESIVL